MDIMTASSLLAGSSTPAGPGWLSYLVFAVAGGIGYAAYDLIRNNRSWTNFSKNFALGAVAMLLFTFVLSYFFHVSPVWIDS